MSRRLLPYGDSGVLVEFDSLSAVMAATDWLREHPIGGVVDVVPGSRTITVQFDRNLTSAQSVRAWLQVADTAGGRRAETEPPVTVPVRYDGLDLASTAEHLGLTPAELIARHAGSEWQVAFCGFTPGFGYLASPDWCLEVPRQATPRTTVPAGAVALAAEFSGVYPRSTPGGWQLIGTTELAMWDADRQPAALLSPGRRVRFEAVG